MQTLFYTLGTGVLNFNPCRHGTSNIPILPVTSSLVERLFFILFRNIGRTFFLVFISLAFGVSPVAAQENDGLFVIRIQLNDTCFMEKAYIDSVYALKGELSFPPIREIELEIGHLTDSLSAEWEFRLDSTDREWNRLTSGIARYTYLPGKKYTLLLRRSGSDEPFKAFNFQSASHNVRSIQDEWWFQPVLTLCLLFIPFTIAYFFALNRSRRSLRIEVVRNQIASDLHDAVGANLGAINNMTDLLKKRYAQENNGSQNKIIEKIKSYTGDTISNLQDTVWAINPLNDSIEELLAKMKEFALLMFNAKEIDITYTDGYNPAEPVKLDMQQRHAMFMMFKEIINNIIKHAQASAVSVAIQSHKSSLSIEVQDDGVGFDPAVLHRGNGLKNFQNRAKENFIDLDLQSAPGAGARIKMTIHSLG